MIKNNSMSQYPINRRYKKKEWKNWKHGKNY